MASSSALSKAFWSRPSDLYCAIHATMSVAASCLAPAQPNCVLACVDVEERQAGCQLNLSQPVGHSVSHSVIYLVNHSLTQSVSQCNQSGSVSVSHSKDRSTLKSCKETKCCLYLCGVQDEGGGSERKGGLGVQLLRVVEGVFGSGL